MELSELRQEIDRIDSEIFRLFDERAKVSEGVAAYKRDHGMRVFDPVRERAKVADAAGRAPEDLRTYAQVLMELLMEASRSRQHALLGDSSDEGALALFDEARARTPEVFPTSAHVVCQGVEGAYSQIAACRLFRVPSITYFSTFEGVFRAVRDGFCDYGVVPIENSSAGSVNAVYDLLAQYRFSIVRSLRLKIDHQLLAKPGTRLADITEVHSHEQAVAQCAGFLERLGCRVRVAPNTAMAAELVAKSDRRDVAALSSRACAGLYGLDVLESDVQDTDHNYTRFIVISSQPQVFPGATRTSLMLTVNHEPGSLYRVLERFYALDVNLVKLESRPIPGRDFEFMFYFDLDCPAGSRPLDVLLDALDDVCERCTYFGTYTEVV